MVNTKEKGNLGEDISCKFLIKNDFKIIDRNYYKKWGELDIVAEKEGRLHFFEVKSTTGFSNPEENVNVFKVRQLRKIIQTYMVDKGYGLDGKFSFHVLSVFMNEKTRRAKVKWIDNVIL
jgi:putative endonuclease